MLYCIPFTVTLDIIAVGLCKMFREDLVSYCVSFGCIIDVGNLVLSLCVNSRKMFGMFALGCNSSQ